METVDMLVVLVLALLLAVALDLAVFAWVYYDCNGLCDQRGVSRWNMQCSESSLDWTGLVLSGKGFNKRTPSCIGVGACEQYRGSKYIYVVVVVVVVVVSQVNQVKSEWRFGRTDVGCRMG